MLIERNQTAKVMQDLAAAGIESRRWWAEGCHRQEAFAACPRTALEVTQHLAGHTLALPFHLRLRPAQLNHVVISLAASLGSAVDADTKVAAARTG